MTMTLIANRGSTKKWKGGSYLAWLAKVCCFSMDSLKKDKGVCVALPGSLILLCSPRPSGRATIVSRPGADMGHRQPSAVAEETQINEKNREKTLSKYIGAIDQGTTSTRFLVFDAAGRVAAC